eukprot:TRINITY_DN9061_c0_g1_i1.p1 TRINITY_DN9061_c0_g1~~TRINITY_DN9061_c0_g1_i1.p1  ORF type:complete len:643 (+),score=148.76 TRINITY_DN9061_c0_g1_i1:42-1970(+)
MSFLTNISFVIHGLKYFTKSAFEKAKSKFTLDLVTLDLSEQSIMVTGANSGLGLAASKYFAERGATVHIVCRNPERGEIALADIKDHSGNEDVFLHLCDLGESDQIVSMVEHFVNEHNKLDVLVNNAGAMLGEKYKNSRGIDMTFAVNTLSNFHLTHLLLPILKQSNDPRVIFVSSGGGLTEKLLVREYYDSQKKWSGMTAYARTKRQQIALCEKFAEVEPNVKFYSMHPGWADTPGVQDAMVSFHQKMEGKLRTIEQGADTICWLAANPDMNLEDSGTFYRDRKPEIKHFTLGKTNYSKNEADSLWNWCGDLLGMNRSFVQIREAYEYLRDNLELKKKRKGLSTYKGAFKGEDVIPMLSEFYEVGEEDAQDEAAYIYEAGFMNNVNKDRSKPWDPSSLYVFTHVPSTEELLSDVVSDEYVAEMLEFMDLEATGDEWVLKQEKDDDTLAYIRPYPDTKLKCVKVRTTNESDRCSMMQLEDLLHTNLLERHIEWNDTFLEGWELGNYDDPNVSCQYWRYKVNLKGAEDRDFVVVRRRVDLENGGFAIFERSIEHGLMPVRDCIRCDLKFQIRLQRPIDDNGLIELVVVNLTDIKGWFPTAVTNAAAIGVTATEMKHIKSAALSLKETEVPDNLEKIDSTSYSE